VTSSIHEELVWRDLIAQISDTEELPKRLAAGPMPLYSGFDPTADSLHVGNLVPLMTLRRFQMAGHPPVALLGGATGLIGDPSGKSQERNLRDLDYVEACMARIRPQLETVLDFSGPLAARVVNNYDWIKNMSAIAFLRDLGKHFPMGAMLAKDSVKSRLGRDDAGLSYTEFSYMILQAYDFLHLSEQFGCLLQIGGNDQWGNITAGIDLIRRRTGAQAYAITMPLLTTATGEKFGKTEAGAVWLDARRTSPYAFYQYWLNADDRDAVKLLKIFTLLSRDEIAALEHSVAEQPHLREAQKRLAAEVTRLIHGPAELDQCMMAAQALFGGGDLSLLSPETLEAAVGSAPSIEYPAIDAVPPLAQVLVDTGLLESKSKARQMLSSGGIYVNNQRVDDAAAQPAASDFLHGRLMIVRRGKKHYAIARIGMGRR
jgi:tyrosyl-tRNA synthetase